MMLIKLLPDQISREWALIRWAIKESIPPMVEVEQPQLNKILEGLIAGRIQCWISVNEDQKPNAVIVTMVTSDVGSGTRNLMIYAITALQKTDGASWISGFETLKKFAKGAGCHKIIGFSQNSKIFDLLGRLGCDTSWRLITAEV